MRLRINSGTDEVQVWDDATESMVARGHIELDAVGDLHDGDRIGLTLVIDNAVKRPDPED